MSYLTANMKMIADCADKLAHLGEKLFNETEMKKMKIGQTAEFSCPEGYEFRDENGNVIEAQKIVLEKKKPKYPKTLRECKEILEKHSDEEVEWYRLSGYRHLLLEKMQFLLICRDAYWKLAGDWKPDWRDSKDKYIIALVRGEIESIGFSIGVNRILAFPTEEMRDAFYENFKELIEQCKELL